MCRNIFKVSAFPKSVFKIQYNCSQNSVVCICTPNCHSSCLLLTVSIPRPLQALQGFYRRCDVHIPKSRNYQHSMCKDCTYYY